MIRNAIIRLYGAQKAATIALRLVGVAISPFLWFAIYIYFDVIVEYFQMRPAINTFFLVILLSALLIDTGLAVRLIFLASIPAAALKEFPPIRFFAGCAVFVMYVLAMVVRNFSFGDQLFWTFILIAQGSLVLMFVVPAAIPVVLLGGVLVWILTDLIVYPIAALVAVIIIALNQKNTLQSTQT